MIRNALVKGSADAIARYLPSNYKLVPTTAPDGYHLITGEDSAGWTLDGYVIPRLASGLYFAREVEATDNTKGQD